MKYLVALAACAALALPASAQTTYVLSNGVVSASIASPPACYVDANGRTVCPLGKPASTACFSGACPCLPGSTCGSDACPANGGAGGCPCSTQVVNFAGGVSFPLPMAAGKDMGFFLDRPRLFRGHVRGFFARLFHR